MNTIKIVSTSFTPVSNCHTPSGSFQHFENRLQIQEIINQTYWAFTIGGGIPNSAILPPMVFVRSYSQMWCMENQAASCSWSVFCLTPLTNFMPWITSANNLYPLNRNHFFWAVSISLNVMVNMVVPLSQFLVLAVLSLTVANTDSAGLVVLMCCKFSAG